MTRHPRRVVFCAPLLTLACLVAGASPATAQYFGRNKVHYETFDFRVLKTEHFDIHYYPAESLMTADAARMAERWYARLSRVLGHQFTRRPLIFYANHPDFQQTNVIGGFISQGTGGVTEGLRERVVLPFTGIYATTDHVLGHELVHVFQYDIAGGGQTGPAASGGSNINRLPLWLIEGMAEYLSIGPRDPHTAMWLRDAALRNDLPTIRQLTRDPKYFPYRYGQALWAYVGGRWGDESVTQLYRFSLRAGFEMAVRQTLGMSTDSLSRLWLASIREAYLPEIQARTAPSDAGTRVLPRASKHGDMDLAPALSPDGRHVAFFSRRGIFSIDLYVADVATGRIIKRLTTPNTDPHFDALSFINSAGSWSPDGRKLAFVVLAKGDHEIGIFDVASRRVERRIRVRGVGEITDPAWGPDGKIAFSGSAGGISDLYLLDLGSERVDRLTDDKYADLQPSWSPDGRTIAFASDRGEGTSFEQLTYAPMRLAVMDVATRAVRVIPLFGRAKHINPQWSSDGRSIFFISDRGGFSDIYRVALDAMTVTQVTRLATGASGITGESPAMSVARTGDRIVFSVFENSGYTLYRLDGDRLRTGTAVAPDEGASSLTDAGVLPPHSVRAGTGVVAAYLSDATTGLPPAGTPFDGEPYRPSLRLDYVGAPTVGAAVTPFGTAVGGSIALYFGDLLGDRVVGTIVEASGTIKDIAGQVFYLNQKRRWNWLVGGSHVPYLTGGTSIRDTTVRDQGGNLFAGEILETFFERTFVDQLQAGVQYPLSLTRRLELTLEGTHVGFDIDVQRLVVVGNTVVEQGTRDEATPPGFAYGRAVAALVGDYSIFGFTSPVAGGRYRFEASPTFGEVTFQSALGDYRRYLFLRPVTLAARGLYYGRFGKDSESNKLGPVFVGSEGLIRGYDANSFDVSECTRGPAAEDCPEFDRLLGSQIGIASLELRIPLVGTDELGLINFGFLPIELSPFVDVGAAWLKNESVDWRFDRRTTARVPVVSYGLSARVNLLGYAVGEVYYVVPLQRPRKGAHFGFQLRPGW